MNIFKYGVWIILIFFAIRPQHGNAQAGIGTFPPQVHQQICQESTYTRYLDVFNYGDSVLEWNAEWTPGAYDWVTAEPMSGVLDPKDSVKVAFHFNSAGLPLDNYYAYLQFNSNDPAHPDTVVLAMLHVQALNIIIEPENDSICQGCNTFLHTMVFGCSEEYQFSWTSDPPGFTSSEKSPVVEPHVSTTYTVHVTDGGGSAEKSVYIQVYGSEGFEENGNYHPLSVYPNPTSGKFSLNIEFEYSDEISIRLYDLSGRMVYFEKRMIKDGNQGISVDPGELEKGIYLMSAEFEGVNGNLISCRNKLIIN